MACHNRSLPEYKALMGVYNNNLIVDSIIDQYQSQKDSDLFPSVGEAAEIVDKNKVKFNLKKRSYADAVLQNLRKQRLISAVTVKGELKYFVTGTREGMRETNPAVLNSNRQKIVNYLSYNNIRPETYTFLPTTNSIEFTVRENMFSPEDVIGESSNSTNALDVLEYLSTVLPDVRYKVVNVEEAKKISDKLTENQKDKVNFNTVKSFYYNNTAYIIKTRVTTETAIEEMLHPVVDALYVSRPDIFGKLLVESRKAFPILNQQIKDSYGNDKGFFEEYRNLELVTQALTRYFKKEYENDPGSSFKNSIKELIEWFAELINDIYRAITGNNLNIKVEDLKENVTLTDIAKLLNTEELRFTTGPINNDVKGFPKYSINKNDPEYVRKEYSKKAAKDRSVNNLQRDIIDKLYDTPMFLDEETHTYTNLDTAEEYKSMTSAIKGGLNDPDNLYEMNRLFGKDFDKILQDIIDGKTFDEAIENVTVLSNEMAEDAYDSLSAYVATLTLDGSVILPQVILADDQSKIAGSLDILIIKPDGSLYIVDLKVSKTSIKDANYYEKTYPTNEGSLLQGRSLTTKQQQSIQVMGYAKLANINGFPVAGVSTYHYNLDIEGKGDKQSVKSFRVEGVVQHNETENLEYVDMIIPTIPFQNVVNDLKIKNGFNVTNDPDFIKPEDEKPEELTNEQYTTISQFMKDVITQFSKRTDVLQSIIDSSKTVKPKKETIDKINSLIAILSAEINSGKADIALGRFLNSSKEELENFIKYASNPKSVGKDDYISVVIMFSKFMETYRGIRNLSLSNVINPGQRDIAIAVTDLLNIADDTINQAIENYVMNFIKTNSTRNFTDDDLKAIIKETTDISVADAQIGDLATSTDTILALIDKTFKREKQKIEDDVQEFSARAIEIGNRLAALSNNNPSYDFMLVYDKDGKFTGRYVQKIGYQYYKMFYELRNKLIDNNGNWLEYINIPNLDDARVEDIKFNQELYTNRQAYSDFTKGEKVIGGKVTDGDFHKYTDDFKKEREKFEEYRNYSWRKKRGITDSQYAIYRNKYYNYSEYTSALKEKDGTFIGATTLRKAWFVKPEFKEVRDIAADGTNMVDEKYIKIMNPKTDLERAQKEFYEFWLQEFENGALKMLPPSVKRDMTGKLPRQAKNFFNKLKESPSSATTLLTKSVSTWFKSFTDSGYQKVVLTDEEGNVIETPPIFFTGKLKSQYTIDKIKSEIQELQNNFKDGKISTTKYREQIKNLEQQLKRNESMLSKDELNTDLVDSLIKFRAMASNYQHLSNAEDTIFALKRVVENREYSQSQNVLVRTATGTKAKTVSGLESRTATRLKKWLKMVYYEEQEFDKTTADNVISKVLNATSLSYVGFNIFGNLNNYLMGRINNGIETGGQLFYDRKAMLRASSIYNSEYLPGVFKGLASSKGYYGELKPQSKYEALLYQYRMVDTVAQREVKEKGGLMEWGFFLQDAAETNVQSKVGIAILMSKQILNDKGESLSLYDAYNFDPNTGQLSLKPGFELSDTERYDVRNNIREVNKQIHGNYSAEDRAALQDYSIGKLVFQFHKWVYPAFKARFKREYYDENLGWIEGRYRTFANFISHIKSARGDIFTKIRDAKESLREDQIKNLNRVATELTFILSSFALAHIVASIVSGMGLDDDDKELKRLLNAMAYQADRQTSELTSFISPANAYMLMKSPIASSKLLGELGEAVSNTFAFPYNYVFDEESLYYKQGSRKGELKLNKQWSDALPILYTINRWESYDNVTDFYVK
jgi:hypothetical protein